MGIYIFTLFLVFFLWIVMNKVKFTVKGQEKIKNKNKAYVIIIGSWLFLVAALRNYTVGADTYTYLSRYIVFASSEWKSIFRIANRMMFEYGFAVTNKLLSYISSNPRILLVVAAFVIVSLFCFFIYKDSRIPWLSFFMYITLGMFGDSLSAMRQYIAVALILVAYNAIKNNKFVLFIVMVLLAAMFHRSALLVLPMFWISKIRFNKLHFCLILGFAVAVFAIVTSPMFKISDTVINFFSKYTTYVRYLYALDYGRSGGAIGLTLIYSSFLFLIILKLYKSNSTSRNMYIAFALASAALTLTTFFIGISERLLPFFAAMFIFSIPEAVMNEPKSRVRLQYISVICVILIIYYIGIVCRANSYRLIPYQLWDNTMKWFY